MKKIKEEFKTFIFRGNVVDMAVGIIVGGAFTAIVNALCNNILKPITNFLLATIFNVESLSEVYTFLKKVEVREEVLNEAGEVVKTRLVPDLEQSIYIDWGLFINSVISFVLIAVVLFTVVKIMNKLRDGHKDLIDVVERETYNREERKELRAAGIDLKDRKAAKAYYEAKAQREAEEAKAAEERLAEEARLHRLENPTTEDLLKEILNELRSKNNN